jgi:restriction system protein
MEAEETDNFWSGGLEQAYSYWVEGNRELAVRKGLECWVENVQQHLADVLGPGSLFPFESKGISWKQRAEDTLSIGGITLALDSQSLDIFIDSVLVNSRYAESQDGLLLQCVIQPYEATPEGKLIHAISIPWRMIIGELKNDWQKASQIPPRKWEELIAAAFDQAGYDEVILTPRSGDHGRDVIAIKRGVGSVRIIDSVKAYKAGNLVRFDDVRALAGVLLGDQRASKGIITTTSSFAPGIVEDPFIRPLLPYRLELMDGAALQKWLEDLALMGSAAR